MSILNIGDRSENGQVTIVDEDRLCYIVRSKSKGAEGLRTISKRLLKEFFDYRIRVSNLLYSFLSRKYVSAFHHRVWF